MFPLIGTLTVASLLINPFPATVYDRVVSDATSGSFLVVHAPGAPRGRLVPYTPHEGDLVFYDDDSVVWGVLYKVAWTGPPFHAGIVVKRPDGRPALLEAGPNDSANVYLLDALPRLQAFQGKIQVRRLKYDLSPEQSAAMTKFALEQEGKRYAKWRLILQGTPFRARGPVRSRFYGETIIGRDAWLCAEIAVAAATVAGIFNPQVVYANCTYPIDIIDNKTHDLSPAYEDAALWTANPHGP